MALINSVAIAVKFYGCAGSEWQYNDKIPAEVKKYIAILNNVSVEDIENLAKDWVTLPAKEFNAKDWENIPRYT